MLETDILPTLQGEDEGLPCETLAAICERFSPYSLTPISYFILAHEAGVWYVDDVSPVVEWISLQVNLHAKQLVRYSLGFQWFFICSLGNRF